MIQKLIDHITRNGHGTFSQSFAWDNFVPPPQEGHYDFADEYQGVRG